MFIASYEFLIIVLKFWGPIAYAFGTLGTRAKQFSNMILSFGLVATIVGRPFAIFFLELGQVALQTTPLGKVGFFAMAFVVGSYVAAFVSQIVLFFVCYKGISAIEGFIGARIRGTTETLIRQTIRVDVQNIRKNNRAGLHPVPVPVPVRRQMVQDAKTRAKREGAKAAARKATTVASAAALATGHPAAGAALNKAGGNLFGKKPSDTNT
jgi:hypothetical protein